MSTLAYTEEFKSSQFMPFLGAATVEGLRRSLPDVRPRVAPSTDNVTVFEQAAPPPARLAASTAREAIRFGISKRIYQLTQFAHAEGDAFPLPSSTLALWRFVDDYNVSAEPLLSTNYVGHIEATWRRSQEEMLTLRFLGGRSLEFAWTHRDERGKLKREWGEAVCCESSVQSWIAFIATL